MRDGAEADEPDFDDEATEMGEDGEIMKSKRKAGAKASMSFKDRMAMMADGAEEFEITRGRGVKGDRGQSTTMTLEEREKAERRRLKEEGRKAKQRQAERQVFIPSSVTVSRLAGILGLKWSRLQIRMAQLGMSEEQRRSDYSKSRRVALLESALITRSAERGGGSQCGVGVWFRPTDRRRGILRYCPAARSA